MSKARVESYEYECCICETFFEKNQLCEHSHNVIMRNVDKFAMDDMVMCVSCCLDYKPELA